MPLSKYDQHFGGKAGSAQEAHDAMVKQYGAEKGERVFYATKARNAKKGGKRRRGRGLAAQLTRKK